MDKNGEIRNESGFSLNNENKIYQSNYFQESKNINNEEKIERELYESNYFVENKKIKEENIENEINHAIDNSKKIDEENREKEYFHSNYFRENKKKGESINSNSYEIENKDEKEQFNNRNENLEEKKNNNKKEIKLSKEKKKNENMKLSKEKNTNENNIANSEKEIKQKELMISIEKTLTFFLNVLEIYDVLDNCCVNSSELIKNTGSNFVEEMKIVKFLLMKKYLILRKHFFDNLKAKENIFEFENWEDIVKSEKFLIFFKKFKKENKKLKIHLEEAYKIAKNSTLTSVF